MSVLVVGQDPGTIESIAAALDTTRLRVVSVAGGRDGLTRLASKVDYRVVVLDLKMPDMDGFHFLRLVRGNPRFRNMPLLVCSQVSDSSTVMKALETGAHDYLVKPVEADTLRNKIARLLSEVAVDVLVVDDDPIIRELLQRILSREGFSVEAVESVDRALETLENRKFSVVISDVEMPERNGFELLEYLRENNPRLPVLMITGKSEKYTRGQILSAGARGFITKPFKNTEIVEKVISLF
mgnify:CR=1 FL=1